MAADTAHADADADADAEARAAALVTASDNKIVFSTDSDGRIIGAAGVDAAEESTSPPFYYTFHVAASMDGVPVDPATRYGTAFNLRFDRVYAGVLPATSLPVVYTGVVAVAAIVGITCWLARARASPLRFSRRFDAGLGSLDESLLAKPKAK